MRQIRVNEQMEKIFTEELWGDLSVEEQNLIKYLYKKRKIMTKKTTEILAGSPGYSRNLLRKLQELEILVWKGSSLKDPTQYYELNIGNGEKNPID